MTTIETKHDGAPGLAWILLLALVVVLEISAITYLANPENGGDTQPAVETTAAVARTVPTAPISRVIEVDSVWVRVAIPSRHWLQTMPNDTIEMRLLDGRVFDIAPDGQAYVNGEPVRDGESAEDVIPGFAVDLRSKSGGTTSVVTSVWPKGS